MAFQLEAKEITKRFPGSFALDSVSLRVRAGEVLALIGENGAGKSTLMKILAGIEVPDSGRVLIGGAVHEIDSVQTAFNLGIRIIHQELNLADNLDIASNVFLGHEPRRGRLRFVDRNAMYAQTTQLLNRLGLRRSPRTKVHQLSTSEQQLVEIARSLAVEARLLIMDEPTSSLSSRETDHLFNVIRNLKEQGVAVIYISHRLQEIMTLADRVEVLRDGRNSGSLSGHEIQRENMVRCMVGRSIPARLRNTQATPDADFSLEVEDLKLGPWSPGLNFRLRRGEIVGLAGLVGAGRTALLETLFGLRSFESGCIRLHGHELQLRNSQDAIRAGLILVPEDRKQHGLILGMSVTENFSLSGLHRWHRWGLRQDRRIEALAGRTTAQLRLKTSGLRQSVENLSGGNQQKVVLAKWLALDPQILLLDEPTRGVDVGAKQELYDVLQGLVQSGVTILLASSELQEILAICDRCLVMYEGRFTGEIPGDQLSEETIMHLATGAA